MQAAEEVVHGSWTGLLESAQYPVQHVSVVEQTSPMFRHSGVSQKQAAPLHGILTLEPGSWSVRHCRPVQQLASVVQDCESPEQVGGGGPHTALLHTSVALQQGMVSEQACDVCAHVGGATGAVQVPLVSPGRMRHVSGVQQSPFTVQLPPVGTHAEPPGVAQWPVPSQNAEQHCAPEVQTEASGMQPPQTTPSRHQPVQHWSPEVQASPGAAQAGGGGAARHRFPPGVGSQVSPVQQSAVTAQVLPCGLQVPFVSAQRRTPAASGTQGAELQH